MELKTLGTIVGGDGKTPIIAAQALSVMLYVHAKRCILGGDRSGVLRIYRKAITPAATVAAAAVGSASGKAAAPAAQGGGAKGGAQGSSAANGTSAALSSGNGLATNAIAEFKDHRGAILCIVQGADPEIVFTGSADRSIKMWVPWVGDGKRACIQTLSAHGGSVLNLAVRENFVYSGSTDNTIIVWKASEGREMMLYPWYSRLQQLDCFQCWVTAVDFSSSSVRTRYGEVFIATSDGRLWTCEVATSKGNLRDPEPWSHHHRLGVSRMKMLPQDNSLITLGNDGTMRIFDSQALTLRRSLPGETTQTRITDMSLNEIAQELYLVDDSGHLRVWSTLKERVVDMFRIPTPFVGVAAVPDTDEIILASPDSITLHQLVRGKKYHELAGHEGPVFQIQQLPTKDKDQERLLLSAGMDNVILTWDSAAMVQTNRYTKKSTEITCIKADEELGVLFIGFDNGSICVWSPITMSESTFSSGHSNTVSGISLRLSPRFSFLVSVSYDATVCIWELTRTRLGPHSEESIRCNVLARIPTPCTELHCVEYASSVECVAVGGTAGYLHLFEPEHGGSIGALVGHTDDVTCMCQDVNLLITGSDDHSIRVWDLRSRVEVGVLNRHIKAIRDLKMVSEHGFLVSCGCDNYIYVWDYTTQTVLQSHSHDRDTLRCSLYSGSRGDLIVGTESGRLVVFPLLSESAWRRFRKDNPDASGPEMYQPWQIISTREVSPLLGMLGFALSELVHQDDDVEESLVVTGEDGSQSVNSEVLQRMFAKSLAMEECCSFRVLRTLKGEIAAAAEVWSVSSEGEMYIRCFATSRELRGKRMELLEPLLRSMFEREAAAAVMMDAPPSTLPVLQSLGFTWCKPTSFAAIPAAAMRDIEDTIQRRQLIRVRCVLRATGSGPRD